MQRSSILSSQILPRSAPIRRASSSSLSASLRSCQASGVAPPSVRRATRCSLAVATALGFERRLDPLQRAAPVFDARNIDAHAPEFGDAGQPLLDRNAAAVVDGDQGGRLWPGLVDVAPLRIARHHDRCAVLIDRPLVDVAERPIRNARPVQVCESAGRVTVMRGRAAKACMQHADVDGAGHRLAELREQALGRMFLGEAHPVDRDVERSRREPHGLGAAGKHRDRLRQRQLAGDARLGVMVAADDEGRDLGFVQPSKLIGEKARRLHRGLLAVVEVAGDQERVHFLGEADIDDRRERPARRAADQVGERRLTQRQRAERRIEVHVGGVDESEAHRADVRPKREHRRDRSCRT